MHWYVVQAFSGYEKKVKEAIEERIELSKLGQYFGRVMVPTEEVVEMKAGKRQKSQRKFFPGYVLIEMELNDESWQLVRTVPRVSGFLGGDAKRQRPSPISEHEVDTIMGRLQEGIDKPRPKTLFEVGQLIRVIDGPFADFSGCVEDVSYDKSKIKVSISIFGRSTPVELDFFQVVKEE